MFVSGLFTYNKTRYLPFKKNAMFRPFFTLASIFFLYEHFGHKFLFKSYKEKHYFRNSYQINCDLISNCSNKIFG